ncbi:MAG TPA: FxSxx-COOH system tetratricopeptide repeat protein [Ktedonobacteraceae bacterium]|nr:FxSxx-COOH system tetratricopeptide repeat protein [Ktedonobacteraceae bacterium]
MGTNKPPNIWEQLKEIPWVHLLITTLVILIIAVCTVLYIYLGPAAAIIVAAFTGFGLLITYLQTVPALAPRHTDSSSTPHHHEQKTQDEHAPSTIVLGKSSTRTLPSGEVEVSPIYNRPYARNPFFTGRDAVLERIHTNLIAGGGTTSRRVQAICGLGGIGKTQIALEYSYRYEKDYLYIFWINASTPNTIIASLAETITLLELPQKEEQDQQALATIVKRELRHLSNWLLILDNVDELDRVSNLFPTEGKGHILFTTQLQVTTRIAEPISVERMDKDEATQLLLRRSRKLALNDSLEQAKDDDRRYAEEVVKEMDRLPLALDQAGAFIEETECSLAYYLDRYRTSEMTFLQRRGGYRGDHSETVIATWSLSFEQVKQQSAAAGDLIGFLALLTPDEIPKEMLIDGLSELGPNLANNPHLLDEAIGTLRKFSLVQLNPDGTALSMHRLVQVVLKENMHKKRRRQWAEKTVRVVNRAFPDALVTTWERCERYLPQVRVCAKLIEEYAFIFPEAIRLLHEAAIYLKDHALYTEAETFLKLAMRQRKLRLNRQDKAGSLNIRAQLCIDQRKYDEAEPLVKQALAIRERRLGLTHPDTAGSLNTLALLYIDKGIYEQAELPVKQALAIRKRKLELNHPDTASSFHTLALFYTGQSKYEQAESHYRQALARQRKALDPDHPDTATTLHNLATLYMKQGKYEQAEPLYLQALQTRDKVFGSNHPNTATTRHKLATLYMQQGKYNQAEPLYQQAQETRDEALGNNHPDTATTLHDLSLLYLKQGKYEQAEPFMKRAFKIRDTVLGFNHPDTIDSFNSLALIYKDQDKYAEAEPFYRQALSMCERERGPDHLAVADALDNLALLYDKQAKYAEAEPLYQRALTIREKTSGADPMSVASTLNNLAILYHNLAVIDHDQKKYDQAESYMQRTLEIKKKSLGRNHPEVATSLNRLAVLYYNQGDYKKGDRYTKQAQKITEKAAGTNQQSRITRPHNLETPYQQQSTVREETFASNDTDTVDVQANDADDGNTPEKEEKEL